ncbi:hypothetical protein BN1221_01219c [Brenneria goodwinii]|uniref:Uncharacterized protein n=1 Tax=Brenneria goodwinii TaxID=1109412 RepID=A0A0G4JSC1_9GAMM|nr:hypothetical protein BN1221_01219c [Brenneria goodwinii]
MLFGFCQVGPVCLHGLSIRLHNQETILDNFPGQHKLRNLRIAFFYDNRGEFL